MKKKIFMLIFVCMAGCAPHRTPIPAPQSAQAGLYVEKCGACHSVPHPMRHTFGQWKRLIAVMEKQRAHRGMAPLADNEKSAILEYLKNHSR